MTKTGRGNDAFVTVAVVKLGSTENAIRLHCFDAPASQEWIPRSLLSYHSEEALDELPDSDKRLTDMDLDDGTIVEIRKWKAKQLGWV